MTDARRNEDRLAWAIALGVAVLAVLFRIAPYYFVPRDSMWHMMPVGALALFAGTRLRSPWAVAIPLASTLAADLLLISPLAAIGWPSFTWATPFVYLCFVGYFLIGHAVARIFPGPLALPGALLGALSGSVMFFLVTNAGSWLVNLDGRYSPGLAGLGHSYRDALPFFRGTLQGDLLFTLYIFGLYELLTSLLPAPRAEGQPA